MKILTPEQIRAVEQAAIDHGIAHLRLMENAGSAAARLIRQEYDITAGPVTVLCGNGNNGGDGLVVARKLMDEGAAVSVVLVCGLPKTADAREMLERFEDADRLLFNMETEPYAAMSCVRESALIIDAIYGLGFHGELPNRLRALFRLVNESAAPVAAIDLPSGLDGETCAADVDTIHADMTVTFTAMKQGLAADGAQLYCGKTIVASIGIDEFLPSICTQGAEEITRDTVAARFSPRSANSHKGDYGRLMTLCGSRGMPGAAVLALRGALRCGVGLAEAAVPATVYPILAAQLCEPVYCVLDTTPGGDIGPAAWEKFGKSAKKATAILAGCGLGLSDGACELVMQCLTGCDCPVVLDADGINIISRHINILKTVCKPVILTPHPGEMSRLTGLTVDEIQADRVGAAVRFSEEYGVTVALKGQGTVIASPGFAPAVNTTGNPGMAKGGSGDVLAGMLASLLAQGMTARDAAMCSVYLHGAAGDAAAERLSCRAMLPSDIIDCLCGLFSDLESHTG